MRGQEGGPIPRRWSPGAQAASSRAVAARFARDGFAVVVHYAGGGDRAHGRGEIQAGGGRAAGLRANVADAADVEPLF
jgi:3-oxoacyl-[acyl-carrier protein] reductase